MDLRRALQSAAVGLTGFAAAASAQLVPLARCHAALPCSIPYGLRPADSVANNPDSGIGNSLIGIELGRDGLKPHLAVSPISEDPVESAARMYVHRNPIKSKPATPAPTPAKTERPPPKP